MVGNLEKTQTSQEELHNNLGPGEFPLTRRSATCLCRFTGCGNSSATQTATRLCRYVAKLKGIKDDLRAWPCLAHRPLRKINCTAHWEEEGTASSFRSPADAKLCTLD